MLTENISRDFNFFIHYLTHLTMIDEVFQIVSAVNRLKDKVSELGSKIDSLMKTTIQQPDSNSTLPN